MGKSKSSSTQNKSHKQEDILHDPHDSVKLKLLGSHFLLLLNRWSDRREDYQENIDEAIDRELVQIKAAEMINDIDDQLTKLKKQAEFLNIQGFENIELPEPLAFVFASLIDAGKRGLLSGALLKSEANTGDIPTTEGIFGKVIEAEIIAVMELLRRKFRYNKTNAAKRVADVLNGAKFSISKEMVGKNISWDTIKRWPNYKLKDPDIRLVFEKVIRDSQDSNEEAILERLKLSVLGNRFV